MWKKRNVGERLSTHAQERFSESYRMCLFNLIRVFRNLMKQYAKEYGSVDNKWKTIKWETINKGTAFAHLAVSENFIHSGVFDSLKNDLRLTQGSLVSEAFEHLGVEIPRKTHELRRLYACYSYQFFGVHTMKEMAYAQRVLGHRNLETSAFYTSLQIKLIPGTGLAGKTHSGSDQAKDFMNTVKSQVDEYMKKMMPSLPLAIENGWGGEKKKVEEKKKEASDDDEEEEEEEDEDEEEKIIPKFKRLKGNGYELLPDEKKRAIRIKRALDAIKEMKNLGMIPTKSWLKKLGESSPHTLQSTEVNTALGLKKQKK